MSSSIKIRILNKTLDISFDEGDCAKDICASLSIKGYPADFQLVRDDKLPLDKWAPLDPKQVYNFLPSTPKKTTEPTQASPAIPIQEPTQASPPPNPEPSHLQEASPIQETQAQVVPKTPDKLRIRYSFLAILVSPDTNDSRAS